MGVRYVGKSNNFLTDIMTGGVVSALQFEAQKVQGRAIANAPTNLPSGFRTLASEYKNSFQIDVVPWPIKLPGGPRSAARVSNTSPYAAAIEYGNTKLNIVESHPLKRAI